MTDDLDRHGDAQESVEVLHPQLDERVGRDVLAELDHPVVRLLAGTLDRCVSKRNQNIWLEVEMEKRSRQRSACTDGGGPPRVVGGQHPPDLPTGSTCPHKRRTPKATSEFSSSSLPRRVSPGNDVAELDPWFDEFERLAAEARHRFDQGDVISALASLAAVPMVHEILVNHCGSITSNQPEADQRPGLYL